MKPDRKFIEDIFRNHKAEPVGKHRFYSVLVPFVEKDGELYLMFEKRADDIPSDPGEICFPGGRMEGEETADECAVRETVEELGISSGDIEITGEGNTLYGYANYTIYSRIGFVSYEAFESVRPNSAEVGEVFLLPFSYFQENAPEVYTEPVDFRPKNFPYERVDIPDDYKWRKGTWEIPVYETEGRIVWGLTARIIESTVRTVSEFQEPVFDEKMV